MIDLFEQYATDETAENDGVWIPHGDSEFLIARSGNKQYSKQIAAEYKKNEKLLAVEGDAASKLSDKIMIDLLATTVLKGWRTKQADESYLPVIGYKRKPLEYSSENAKMVLAHKDFRKDVAAWSDDMTKFKAELLEEQVKN